VRKSAVLLLALAGCETHGISDPQRYNLTEEELAAGPSYNAMKAALVNDVRRYRMLHLLLDQGRPSCPAVGMVNGRPTCAVDKAPFEVYTLSSEAQDSAYRVEEVAYYCRTEFVYHYHYVGGPQQRDVWLGPFKLKRERPKADD
jgi:hypothetical protein